MQKRIATNLVLTTLVLVAASTSLSAQQPAADVVEQGKFTLHKFEQPIGEETYEIRQDGDSLAAKSNFKFTDRGQAVPLSVTFRSARDLTPQSFEIKGRTCLLYTSDAADE